MKPAARVGDKHDCPHSGHSDGTIQEGAGGVLINDKKAARLGDAIECGDGSQHIITEGSDCVFIEGKAAARQEDETEHGGKISSGSGNVFIGTGGNTQVRIGPGVRIGGNGNQVRIGGATIGPTSTSQLSPLTTSVVPEQRVAIDLYYHKHNDEPIAQAYYTVKFNNGEIRRGQLDGQGHAHLADVPKSEYEVTYSTLKAEDAEPEALPKIDKQLAILHQQLAKYLDELVEQAKQDGDSEQQIFDHETLISKSFILTGAVLDDGWEIIKQTVKGLWDIIKTGARLHYDVEIMASPSPFTSWEERKKAAHDFKAQVDNQVDKIEEIAVDAKLFWWAASDPVIRQVMLDFAIRYWHALSIAGKVKEAGYAPMFLLMVLITKRVALPALRGVALDSTTIALTRIAELQERRNAILKGTQGAAQNLRSVQYLKKILFLPPGTITEFHEGGSALMPVSFYNRYFINEKTFGRPDGAFITSKKTMDALLAKTRYIPDLEKALGIEDGTWLNKDGLMRIDIDNPFEFNGRLPKCKLSAANEQFKAGGKTIGGHPELVIDQITGEALDKRIASYLIKTTE